MCQGMGNARHRRKKLPNGDFRKQRRASRSHRLSWSPYASDQVDAFTEETSEQARKLLMSAKKMTKKPLRLRLAVQPFAPPLFSVNARPRITAKRGGNFSFTLSAPPAAPTKAVKRMADLSASGKTKRTRFVKDALVKAVEEIHAVAGSLPGTSTGAWHTFDDQCKVVASLLCVVCCLLLSSVTSCSRDHIETGFRHEREQWTVGDFLRQARSAGNYHARGRELSRGSPEAPYDFHARLQRV